MRARAACPWRTGGLAALLGLLLAAPASHAAAPRWDWEGVRRIVAIGDVHGDYDNFVAILRIAGLVDEDLDWIGGDTHLVQNGDVVDRGPDSRRCIELLMRLEKQARKAGGAVHALIGNHEAMNVVGLYDYVSPEEIAAFVDPDSRRRREKVFETYYRNLEKTARAEGEPVPPKHEAREAFEGDHPLGWVEHRAAFAPDGRYGRWIAGHNVAVRIDGIVFSHGDWSETAAAIGIEETNRRVREELAGKAPLEGGLTFHPEGPLQYRGLSRVALRGEDQRRSEPRVDRILAALGARAMVVGHTTTDGLVEPRWGGKHVRIDVGILRRYRTGGNRIALEIDNGRMAAIHPEGKVPLPEWLDETTLVPYLEAIARVDAENLLVHEKLAKHYLERGTLAQARAVLERLLRIPKPVSFQYHRELADVYRRLGEEEEARREALAYIDGVRRLVDESPDNVNLVHLLARYCLEFDVEHALAEELMQRALVAKPFFPPFVMTYARLLMAQGKWPEAAGALDGLVRNGQASYEVYLQLGRAYRGAGRIDAARRAFEKAVELAPERSEARDELRRLGGGEPGPRGEAALSRSSPRSPSPA